MSTRKIFRKARFRILKLLCLPISAILGIFCNSGCGNFGPAPEYGTPHADYQISGTILSADQNMPIEGIAISIRDTLDATGARYSSETDSFGKYSLQFTGTPRENTWRLEAKDTDSTQNGSFISKDTVISIPESDLQDPSGNWYEGHGEKTVDLKLDRNS